MSEPATVTDVTVVEHSDAPAELLPIGNAANALVAYQELQKTLDVALKDSMMTIRGKQFRKKNYWRAVAVAYGLDVEILHDERVEFDDDWGYIVTARATAQNGRRMDGDGSCFASEKSRGQDSIHNVRGHAITRAKNRAISDLCGFGEVSADEMPHEPPVQNASRQRAPRSSPKQDEATANEKQLKMLKAKTYDRAEEEGYPGDHQCAQSIGKMARKVLGITGPLVPKSAVDGLVAAIAKIKVGADGHAIEPEDVEL